MVITYILSSWVLIGYCQRGRFLHGKYIIKEKMIYVGVDMEEIMYSFLNGCLENYVSSSSEVHALCVDQELSMWLEACLKVYQVVMPSS